MVLPSRFWKPLKCNSYILLSLTPSRQHCSYILKAMNGDYIIGMVMFTHLQLLYKSEIHSMVISSESVSCIHLDILLEIKLEESIQMNEHYEHPQHKTLIVNYPEKNYTMTMYSRKSLTITSHAPNHLFAVPLPLLQSVLLTLIRSVVLLLPFYNSISSAIWRP